MRIGHIDLSPHITAAEEQLVVLVESLTAHGVEQHILVRNPFLAKRLSVCSGVTVGPIVRSPLTAYCLMPVVDLVHTHEGRAVNAGLLLKLTRSIPYVLTHRRFARPSNNPISRSKFRGAEGIICPSKDIAVVMREHVSEVPVDTISDARNVDDKIDAENGRISAEKMAAEFLRVYRRALDSRTVPGILL